MRKLIAWPVTWGLFWAGHWASVLFLRHDWTYLYPAFRFYQWAMGASVDVQDWANLSSPWGRPERTAENG